MPVYVVRFEHQSRVRWGVLRGARIVPIEGDFETTGDLVRSKSADELAALETAPIAAADVQILSPVTRNQRFHRMALATACQARSGRRSDSGGLSSRAAISNMA